MIKRSLAEFVGTFSLVFAGTGAIIINEVSHGAIGHAGIAIVFGLIVMAMIHAFGDISGAHINPAVSVAFFVAGKFRLKELPVYIVSQFLGAVTASVVLRSLFPDAILLGDTIPAGPPMQSFILEIILSALLMIVILRVSSGPKEKGLMAGITIGAVVLLEAMFAGPITDASMNPFRSLAPAIVSGHLQYTCVYITAPVTGMLIAVLLNKIFER